ncbi:hypothetical protein [Tortoise microvirus 38]|nr:hypothetical protein [Tortoise microvirus 38]
MKFDPFSQQEVSTNETVWFGKGRLRLSLSARCPLYIEAQGIEALAGIAETFDLDLSEEVSFRVEAPEGVRAFLRVPEPTSFEPEGEVFTNIDRMPHESGSVAEVTRAMRLFELERRAALREIREEAEELRTLRQAAKPQAQPIHQGEGEAEALVDEADDGAAA